MTVAMMPTSFRFAVWAKVASLGLSLTAVAIASYLTAAHYTDPTALAAWTPGSSTARSVTTSCWSVVSGDPLAVIGLVWAIVVTALTVPWAWSPAAAWVDRLRRTVSGAGAATVLYLVYVEFFRIGAICLWSPRCMRLQCGCSRSSWSPGRQPEGSLPTRSIHRLGASKLR